MRKKVRINNDKIKKLISEKLKKDGTFVHETKIDKAIKQYLVERKENKDAPETSKGFSSKALKAFDEMSISLYDIVEDLMIIQTKEGDVLVEDTPTEKYAETYIEEVVKKLELIIEDIEHLRDFMPEDDYDEYFD